MQHVAGVHVQPPGAVARDRQRCAGGERVVGEGVALRQGGHAGRQGDAGGEDAGRGHGRRSLG